MYYMLLVTMRVHCRPHHGSRKHFVFFLFQMPPCVFLSFCYKINGHSQLMHMRLRYHFLADLHITRYAVHTVFNQI